MTLGRTIPEKCV